MTLGFASWARASPLSSPAIRQLDKAARRANPAGIMSSSCKRSLATLRRLRTLALVDAAEAFIAREASRDVAMRNLPHDREAGSQRKPGGACASTNFRVPLRTPI